MEPVHGHGSCTQHPCKGADITMNEDETVDSAKYSKSSSSLSSYSSATSESPLQTESPVQVPDIQVMERPGDIACDRIPASVFESKPSTPTAWSAVSNESLFSIQIGKLSFSREQFLTMSEDKFDELFKSGEMRKSAEIIWSRLHNESPIGKHYDTNEFYTGGKEYEEKDETLKNCPNENFDQLKCGVPDVEGSRDPSTNYSQQSDESRISCQPLAFPKKNKRSGWRLWPCSNYSWDFCLCTWSSFWCKWPSWKCCSISPSCCCTRPSCGCNWPSCGCNWPGCGCNWPSCNCCTWPSCGSCTWPSCSCCKWTSCSCCLWPRSCVSVSKLRLQMFKF